jgi:hypothetical protein
MTSQRERNLSRALAARNLRPVASIGVAGRLVERTGLAERWEFLGSDGCWHRYWRRYGSVPDDAIPVRRARR